MPENTPPLHGATVVISGGSRGIGQAIAARFAEDGANISLIAKTSTPHPSLPGTIHSAARAVEAAGGTALPLVGDIRDDEFVERAIDETLHTFGGIDVIVNNASAIDLRSTEDIDMSRYDLINDINARGTFLLSKLAIPLLRMARNPHILTMSPPILTDPKWFSSHTAYTISKYGMSLVTLGLSEELRADGIAANSLWPRTAIDTAVIRNVFGEELRGRTRSPRIVADAAYAIVTRPSRELTGQFLIDDDVLESTGVTDFSQYLNGGREEDLALDAWVEPKGPHDSAHSLR